MPTVRSFDTTEALGAGPTHCDRSVWPDDPGWYRLLERHVFAARGAPRVRVFEARDGELSALLVLTRERVDRFGGCRLRALQNYYTSDYRPLCSAGAARALIAPLVGAAVASERADVVVLSPLESDAPETARLREAFAALGWPTRTDVAFANWVCDVEGSFERYLARRPSRLRSTLRRKRARFEALPGATLEVHDGSRALGSLIERYRRVYARSWKAPEPYAGFVPALIERSARRGELRLGLASVDGEPIAVHFWIVKGGRASIYKLAHDVGWESCSPGTVLMATMLEHVIERDRVSRIDFLSGDDAYKRDWMDERREKLELLAFNPRSARGLAALARARALAPLARSLRRFVRDVVPARGRSG